MKKKLLIFMSAFMLITAVSFLQANSNPSHQARYIESYADIAVGEMRRSGIPASITLAQGLLESGCGRSELAVKGNNHFGIKCHKDWTGERIYFDDDEKGECFRKYETIEHSYRDHSDFLRFRDRYKFLFDLEPTDYKGWAHGLRKAGYATDPSYPSKLIRLIEEYELHKYDSMPSLTELPESPNTLERDEPLNDRQRRTFHFALTRQMGVRNGVPFVVASEGETFESIAESYSLFHREILRFNDLDASCNLYPGTVVYIQKKKNKASRGLEKHVVEGDGETLWEISQRYAVKMKKLCKMNGMSPDRKLSDGDVILLR